MDAITSPERMAPHVEASGSHAGIHFREFVCMIAAMMAMMALGIDTMLPALPQIGASLGIADENQRQWIITSYVLSFGLAQLVYGPLSDRYGRRPVLLGGMIGYIIFSIGVALSTSFAMLIAFRALQGIAIAATRVVTTSLVRDCYGGRQMARVMSLAMIIFLAVPILAPSIGQLIMLVFPWRGLFAMLAAYGVVTFLWVLLRLPETLHPDFRRAFNAGIIRAGMRTALTTRQACGYMLVQALLQGALLGFINSVQQVFTDIFQAAKLMPIAFAAIAGMMGVASLLNSRIVERVGTRRVSHAALIGFIAIEGLHLAIVMNGHETIWSFSIAQGIAMFCFGLSMGNFGAMAIEPLAELAGTAASVQGFVVMVGGSVIGLLIGQSFDGTTLPVTMGFVIASLVSLAIVLVTEKGRLFQPHMGD